MERKELNKLVATKEDTKDKQIGVRIPMRVFKKLEAKGVKISETVRNFLERVAEG